KMSKGKAIFLLLRVPFLTVTIASIFLGATFALFETKHFNIGLFFLTLIGASFLHLACNVANDYFDYKSGNDILNKSETQPFSGGSRMILDGFVKPNEALVISFILAILGSGIGLYLNYITKGNVILLVGIIGLLLVYGYNSPPLNLVYKGLGELGIFLAWGPLMVIGSYYVQAQKLSPWVLIVSIPPGILTTLVLLINEFADEEADRGVGRKTFVIIFGRKKALNIYFSLLSLCYLIVIIGVISKAFPILSLIVFLTFPLSWLSYKLAQKSLGKWKEFL
ncbi:prenyltransferase, partial [SCandidatus Aminicenantes bacterium Aminicenantia_JdfR_composite]|nr:prenyltransferase [SCandidatus Aminicenantes bacterium Aminicenantia_JdfR_composite]